MSATPEPSGVAPPETPSATPLWVISGLIVGTVILLIGLDAHFGILPGTRKAKEARRMEAGREGPRSIGRGRWDPHGRMMAPSPTDEGTPRATPAGPRTAGRRTSYAAGRTGPAASSSSARPPTAGPSGGRAGTRSTGHREPGASKAAAASPGGGLGGGSSAAALAEDTVTVMVCTETGLRAGPYCPSVESRTFPADAVPEVCTRHKEPADQQMVSEAVCTQTGLLANPFCPDVEVRQFPADAVPGVCTVHTESGASETVTVSICTQTGLLANQFCPEVKPATFPRNAVPGICTVHTKP